MAEAAGVSIKTVSNVVNDHPHVRPEMRERVKVVDRRTMIDVSRAVAAVQAEEPGAQERLDDALERADEQIDAALESRSA